MQSLYKLCASPFQCLTQFPLWTPCVLHQGSKTIPPFPVYSSIPQNSSFSTMLPFCTAVNMLSLPDTIPTSHHTLHDQGGRALFPLSMPQPPCSLPSLLFQHRAFSFPFNSTSAQGKFTPLIPPAQCLKFFFFFLNRMCLKDLRKSWLKMV